MVRIGTMASPKSLLDRRELLAGSAMSAATSFLLPIGSAQGAEPRLVTARPESLALRSGSPDTPIWSLAGPDLRFKRGERAEITFANDLPSQAILNWRGIDGLASVEPLTVRRPLAAGGRETFEIPLRHAGSYLCHLGMLFEGQARPARSLPLLVAESEAPAVDRDEVVLIEEWRLRPDGTAITPGTDPKDAATVYTGNGRPTLDISARTNERIRIRFINGCQRTVIAIKLQNTEVRVMAIDGQPAEPFLARNGALVIAPGGRTDTFVDLTGQAATSSSILLHDGKEVHLIGKLVVSDEPPIRPAPLPPAPPLPSNGLPAQLDLRSATRGDLVLGAAPGDWVPPTGFNAGAAPAVRAKKGRTVVLALTNRAPVAAVFHLHGHHFRLLDRLDDGWKPFWLDTLAIEPGQTQRIAFLAEYGGRWLIEQVTTDWASPRLVRWYSVE